MLGAYTGSKSVATDKDAQSLVENCADLGVERIMLLTPKREIEERLARPRSGEFDPYAALCAAAKPAGIQVHAWFCLYYEDLDRPTNIVNQHPEYLVVNRQRKTNIEQPTWSTLPGSQGIYWVCASAEEYRDYLSELMTGVIERYGVDGIHLDYVRYPEEVDGRAYCYCERCLRQFREKYGYELPAQDVIKNRYYVSIMCENVSRSVQHFSKLAHDRGKEISAYVFTDYVTAIETCYQDWPWFSRYLDTLIITLYEVQDTYAKTLVERARSVAHEGCKVGTAVYTQHGGRRSSDGGTRWWSGTDQDILDTIRASLDGGSEGTYLFTYDAIFDPKLPPERHDFLVGGIKRICNT